MILIVFPDINKRIRIAKSKANFEEVADLYNQLGNQHRLLGNYDFAVDAHQVQWYTDMHLIE